MRERKRERGRCICFREDCFSAWMNVGCGGKAARVLCRGLGYVSLWFTSLTPAEVQPEFIKLHASRLYSLSLLLSCSFKICFFCSDVVLVFNSLRFWMKCGAVCVFFLSDYFLFVASFQAIKTQTETQWTLVLFCLMDVFFSSSWYNI